MGGTIARQADGRPRDAGAHVGDRGDDARSERGDRRPANRLPAFRERAAGAERAAALAGAREGDRDRHRRPRAADRFSGQRPAGGDARLGRAGVSAPPRARARARDCLHHDRRRLPDRSRLARRRSGGGRRHRSSPPGARRASAEGCVGRHSRGARVGGRDDVRRRDRPPSCRTRTDAHRQRGDPDGPSRGFGRVRAFPRPPPAETRTHPVRPDARRARGVFGPPRPVDRGRRQRSDDRRRLPRGRRTRRSRGARGGGLHR